MFASFCFPSAFLLLIIFSIFNLFPLSIFCYSRIFYFLIFYFPSHHLSLSSLLLPLPPSLHPCLHLSSYLTFTFLPNPIIHYSPLSIIHHILSSSLHPSPSHHLLPFPSTPLMLPFLTNYLTLSSSLFPPSCASLPVTSLTYIPHSHASLAPFFIPLSLLPFPTWLLLPSSWITFTFHLSSFPSLLVSPPVSSLS